MTERLDQMAAAMVKPLVWECVGWSSGDGVRGENDDTWEAVTQGSDVPYIIDWMGGGRFIITTPTNSKLEASSLEAAQAAAQSLETARILAAVPALAEVLGALSEYVCHCKGTCQAEVYGGSCGRAAYAIIAKLGRKP